MRAQMGSRQHQISLRWNRIRLMDLLEDIGTRARQFGLNLIAAIPAERYDRVAGPAYRAQTIEPACRSIVIIGNGGGDFWRCFKAHTADRPGWLARDNPLDDFTREIIETEVMRPVASTGTRCIPVYPFAKDSGQLNFMQLATMAGVAGPSIIGVVVHPVFGPWIAFRAALLIDAEIDHPGDALAFDPCPSCSARSCIAACPAGAVSFPSGWDIPRCLTHRVEAEPDCSNRCHARVACVLAPEHRYPDDELAYHQMRAMRVMLPYYKERIRRS
jgi:epoxyqueuosine reductase